jgi:hypothetical protein
MNAVEILKGKFWVIVDCGTRVGLLQPTENDMFALTLNGVKTTYPTASAALKKNNIQLSKDTDATTSTNSDEEFEVNGFPVNAKPFNVTVTEWPNVCTFTKTATSKAVLCAGYYIVKFKHGWVHSFCPKVDTLSKNEFLGPFKTELEMKEQLRLARKSK